MFQIKEQGQKLQKKLNKTEIKSSQTQRRMHENNETLKEQIENRITKQEAEESNTEKKKMKNTLDGIEGRLDDAKEQISDLEKYIVKPLNQNSKKKK